MLEYLQRLHSVDIDVMLGLQAITLIAYEATKWACRAAWRRDKRSR